MYTYVFGFLSYLLALVIAAILFTYVFYNYFDREVTRDVIVGYNRILTKK